MHSDLFSPTPPPTPSDGTLIFRLEIPGRLPSWNDILGMEQWARYKFKNQLAADFLSALQQSGPDSSMKITCARSTTSTYADTLASYLAMKLERRKLKQSKGKAAKEKPSRSSSKSTKSTQPAPVTLDLDSPFDRSITCNPSPLMPTSPHLSSVPLAGNSNDESLGARGSNPSGVLASTPLFRSETHSGAFYPESAISTPPDQKSLVAPVSAQL